MTVKYRSNDANAGAVPVDTVIKTTESGGAHIQHVKLDTGDGTNTQPVTDVTLASLVEALQELSQRLAPLGGAISAGGSYLRVTQTAVPSTAVTGPATGANVVAALLTQTNSLLTQYGHNLLVNQANIINVTIT